MPLDVWIFGSGFGESTLLAWDTGGSRDSARRRCAIVDTCGGDSWNEHAALLKWNELGRPAVEWVAISHPHLDHIRGAKTLIQTIYESGSGPRSILWWGGLSLEHTHAMYRQALVGARDEGRDAALETMHFMETLVAFSEQMVPGSPRTDARIPVIVDCSGLKTVYSSDSGSPSFVVRAIGAWAPAASLYMKWLLDRFSGEYRRGVANSISSGFWIRYGEAEIVLGGDMEALNWRSLRRAPRPYRNRDGTVAWRMRPCVVKVSHHGSRTAVIDHMWRPGEGFFCSRRSMPDAPHCVITPWRKAGRRLPDANVVDLISKAGCHVWRTATVEDQNEDPRNERRRFKDSYVHFRIDPSANVATRIESRLCLHHPPLAR